MMTKNHTRMEKKMAGKETPLVVWMWMLGMGFLSYLIARIALYASPHPYHWASAVAGAGIGYLVGWLWFRWKGDVI